MSKTVTNVTGPGLARRCTAALMSLAAVVFTIARSAPASAATATMTGVGYGLRKTVQGKIGSDSVKTYGFVGAFHVRIDGGPETDAYSIDMHDAINTGMSQPQATPDCPCEALYILTNAFPHANNLAGTLADANLEAAAVQAAIWKFTDGFAVTSPSEAVARAGQIVNAAKSKCKTLPPYPQKLTLTPPSATNYLPSDKAHTVTATVTGSDGKPLAGQAVDVTITGAAGPQSFHGATNAAGQLAITYENKALVTGTDTITASAWFTLPIGVKFKKPGCGGIVLAGTTKPGKVSDCASKNWVPAKCGDGVVNQAGEQCDDRNSVNGDGCDNNCTRTACGNGVVTAGEACDDGNAGSGDGCDANCTATACGNGIVTAGEECDDGNGVDGDACDSNCTVPRCGNGIVTAGEECDDGNHVNGDTCDNNCTVPRCGNGIVAGGEECDDGNAVDGDGCDSNCTRPACGNGIVTAGESCDDGNLVNGDGCDANCTPTACGNGIVTAGEECDDGNLTDADGCESDCTLPRCGNHILDRDEQCDDGNNADGDGCSATCEHQEICADLEDNDGDGVVDCDDPDCECSGIFKDPATITFRRNGIDMLRLHGKIEPEPWLDPRYERFGIAITSPNGIVYKASLLPGDLVGKSDALIRFLDHAASKGNGTRRGVAKLILRRRGNRLFFTLEAYGDFSRATQPVMTAQLLLGRQAFAFKSEWKAMRNGWKTDFRFPFD